MELYNDDCFNVFPKIGDKTINLFVLDLPYANFKFGKCTACKWDLPIDLDKMWIEIKRIMKPNAVIVFFCNTKFGYALIDSNPKWFKYDLIWKKSRKVGFLSANKQPLRQHENIYVFDNTNNDDLELNRNLDLRNYAEKVYKFIGKSRKQIEKDLGHRRAEHFVGFKNTQFGLPILKTYNELIEKYKINEMDGFLEYDILKDSWEKERSSTYNPQKTEGKSYNCKQGKQSNLYGIEEKEKVVTINKGDRHPTSILPDIELEEHENVYVFNDKKATYNPQKTKGHKSRIRSHNKNADCNIVYGDEVKITPADTTDKRHPTSILPDIELEEHENVYVFNKQKATYNPQKTKLDKEDKRNRKKDGEQNIIYGENVDLPNISTYKDRHPTSILPDEIKSTILEYNNPHKTIHRTQKPEKLLEWLIKTYSNENDVVMDFCMGSGTAGVACKNTNRKFIGIEKDKEIYDLASNRINNVVDI